MLMARYTQRANLINWLLLITLLVAGLLVFLGSGDNAISWRDIGTLVHHD